MIIVHHPNTSSYGAEELQFTGDASSEIPQEWSVRKFGVMKFWVWVWPHYLILRMLFNFSELVFSSMKGDNAYFHDYREDEIRKRKGNGWHNALHIVKAQ